jgi:2-phospho-L-lactate/phosphoenolpyruvate guanylyltransferase
MWAVLPIKSLNNVKTRLASALSPSERIELFRFMMHDVLSALMEVEEIERTVVVTRDPEVRSIAARFDAVILEETSNDGHTAAVGRAAQWLISRGTNCFLQVPADIPGVTPQEVNNVLSVHRAKPGRAFTISPSHDYGGSNCIVCSPPDVIDLSFGEDSFRRHLRDARAAGVECSIVHQPGISLDVDYPQDLVKFMELNTFTHTHRFLARSGLGARVADFVETECVKEEV